MAQFFDHLKLQGRGVSSRTRGITVVRMAVRLYVRQIFVVKMSNFCVHVKI